MQALLRAGFRLLSVISPRAAARIGARLWFRVPRPRISDDARAFLGTGASFELKVKDARVAGWSWGSGPVVLLMHGWGGFAAQLQAFVQPLVAAGFQVVAFDAPSHGLSGPGPLGAHHATLFDFSNTLAVAAQGRGELAGVVTHSGGCAAAAWALTTHPEWRPRRMVFIAPFGSAARYMALFQSTLGLSDGAMRRFREDTERDYDFKWTDFEVPAIADRVKTPPLLVVHDRNDRETAWQDGADIAARWPDATLETTTGLGHNRVLRDPKVVELAVRFLRA